jgi:hypothetical protein
VLRLPKITGRKVLNCCDDYVCNCQAIITRTPVQVKSDFRRRGCSLAGAVASFGLEQEEKKLGEITCGAGK